MINILQKNKIILALLTLLVVGYFTLRLPNLTLQPVFADEAIYIRWAQVMRAEPTLRFLPLSDGKTPLFMWAMMPLFKVFADPLFAGRFLSILAGLMTLVGVFLLSWRFFNLRVALWSAFLVVITPWLVFFDRMALVDSMLAAFSIWSLFLALLLTKYLRIDLAMLLGYALGGGLLTKTPGMFNLLVVPLTLIVFKWFDFKGQKKLLKIISLWGIAFVIAMVIYNLLRLGPGFTNLSSRNQDYIFSPFELINRPLDPFLPHLKDLGDWSVKLLTVPTVLLVFVGSIWSVIRKNRFILTILLWSLVPLLIQAFLLKTFTARYLLFSIPPLLILAGWACDEFQKKLKLQSHFRTLVLVMLLAVWPLYINFLLISNLPQASLPRSERRGYLEDWTAGYGLLEISQFLIEEAKKETTVVGTEGSFGTLPDGLLIYLDQYIHTSTPKNQIMVLGGTATISADLKRAALSHPTYFVANKSRFLGDHNVELIKEFPKTQGPEFPQDALLLFKVRQSKL